VSGYKHTLYKELQDAFDYYNKELFGNTLPKCVITIRKKPNAFGYFHPNRFQVKGDTAEYGHELALNPEYFNIRDIMLSMVTLVHEMVHLWEYIKGAYGRNGYHNKIWAEEMKKIGLIPSDTGEPGGKEVGQHVSHYIDPNGAFIQKTRQLIASGYTLNWYEVTDKPVQYFNQKDIDTRIERVGENSYEIDKTAVVKGKLVKKTADNTYALIMEPEEKKRSGVRVKYSCACCSVWGKEGLVLKCCRCGKVMEAVS
jgi:predicted SprT family Zn-dependent metalloprotease